MSGEQRTIEKRLYPAKKGGRCANGFERDRGTVIHAVPMRDPKDYEMGTSLCGTEPGRRSVGWVHWSNMVVNCPRCLERMNWKPPTPDEAQAARDLDDAIYGRHG